VHLGQESTGVRAVLFALVFSRPLDLLCMKNLNRARETMRMSRNGQKSFSTQGFDEMVFRELNEVSEMYETNKKQLSELTEEIRFAERRIDLLRQILALDGCEVKEGELLELTK
jgi:hypothetical protein